MRKSDKEHLARVAALGCIICRQPAEIHHIRHQQGMGRRAPHTEVLPLCPKHHRTGNRGEAIHAGRQSWEAAHGTERELLERVRAELAR